VWLLPNSVRLSRRFCLLVEIKNKATECSPIRNIPWRSFEDKRRKIKFRKNINMKTVLAHNFGGSLIGTAPYHSKMVEQFSGLGSKGH